MANDVNNNKYNYNIMANRTNSKLKELENSQNEFISFSEDIHRSNYQQNICKLDHLNIGCQLDINCDSPIYDKEISNSHKSLLKAIKQCSELPFNTESPILTNLSMLETQASEKKTESDTCKLGLLNFDEEIKCSSIYASAKNCVNIDDKLSEILIETPIIYTDTKLRSESSKQLGQDDCYELNQVAKPRPLNYLRNSYLDKINMKNIKNEKVKEHNSIIIFDWDDTILCTTYLKQSGIIDEEIEIDSVNLEKLNLLDSTVFQLLSQAIGFGETFIITNSEPGWVEESAKLYYPRTMTLLKNIKIVSARGDYENKFPGDNKQWKIQAFLDILQNVNKKLVTNLICLGDSTNEIEAGHILASKFTQAYIKTIKFKQCPRPSELNKQLKTVSEQFTKIYKEVKNLTIRVERKNK